MYKIASIYFLIAVSCLLIYFLIIKLSMIFESHIILWYVFRFVTKSWVGNLYTLQHVTLNCHINSSIFSLIFLCFSYLFCMNVSWYQIYSQSPSANLKNLFASSQILMLFYKVLYQSLSVIFFILIESIHAINLEWKMPDHSLESGIWVFFFTFKIFLFFFLLGLFGTICHNKQLFINI